MNNEIPKYLLNTIKCIYGNTEVRIKFNDGISEPINTNKGIRQGCGLSSVLFNIYINKIIQEFKRVMKKDIQLNNRKLLNTILYAGDQILIATSEDELQTMAYHLNLKQENTKCLYPVQKQNQWQCGENINRG